MKTAADSSVLLDVFSADPVHGIRSREALRAAYDAGRLVACDVVWAEVRAHFERDADFDHAMTVLGVEFEPLAPEAARRAGELWRLRRGRSPGGARRVMADFLIGAHAATQAEALLTRDRGYYRSTFVGLKVIDPGQ
jgi:predicted nucleic acid-binding protein